LTDEPDAFFAPGRRVFAGTVDGSLARHPADRANPESRQELVVQDATPHKGGLIVKFDAIPDRTVAEQWRQRYLLVPMDELTPPGENEIFMHELLGMAVQGSAGAAIGEVIALYELPQGLTLEVRTATGDVLVPYRPAIVLEVDRDARTVTVDPASGLLD
jgi:16S rRNA processing protein RimM